MFLIDTHAEETRNGGVSVHNSRLFFSKTFSFNIQSQKYFNKIYVNKSGSEFYIDSHIMYSKAVTETKLHCSLISQKIILNLQL